MDQEVKIFGLAGLMATLAIALVAYLSYAPRVNHNEASPLLYQLAERGSKPAATTVDVR